MHRTPHFLRKAYHFGHSLVDAHSPGNRIACKAFRQVASRRTYSISRYCAEGIIDANIESHLGELRRRYELLGEELAKGVDDPDQLAKLGKEYARLSAIVEVTDDRSILIKTIADLRSLEAESGIIGGSTIVSDSPSKSSDAEAPAAEAADDANELALLAQEEREGCARELIQIEERLVRMLTPKDEADERGVVLEVRSGTGGDEASLFASEIFRMYQKFAALQGWRWEEMSLSRSEIGGFKEAQATIHGEEVYRHLKFESGVHRVQRVPVNDVRIQTSAASVIVMPEAEDVDVTLRPQDLKIDVFRSQGAGGQSVNRTESAVRITHLPTGCVVSMQDERSQIQNRARAMKILQTRVYDLQRRLAMQERAELRSAAQGTGDRSDKVRTYNFPQDRVTDHRVSVTVSGVARVMNGEELRVFIDALNEVEDRQRLAEFMESLTKDSHSSS